MSSTKEPPATPPESTLDRIIGERRDKVRALRDAGSNNPVLMIDEMSLGLAPVIVKRMFPVVRRIADEIGAGVLVVEQHIDVALQAADRAYVLASGTITQSGPAAELAERNELRRAYLGRARAAQAQKSA